MFYLRIYLLTASAPYSWDDDLEVPCSSTVDCGNLSKHTRGSIEHSIAEAKGDGLDPVKHVQAPSTLLLIVPRRFFYCGSSQLCLYISVLC